MAKIDYEGLSIFGDEFQGWDPADRLYPRMAAFKEYFIQKKLENFDISRRDIIRGFHALEKKEGRTFFCRPMNLSRGRADKWEDEALAKRGIKLERDDSRLPIEVNVREPEVDLEKKMESLAGDLIEDAGQVMSDNSGDEGVQDMVARKKYAAMVLSSVTRLVHGKRALDLKTSEERRNNTSFLLDFLKKATAGKITNEEMNLLKPTQTVQESTQTMQNA